MIVSRLSLLGFGFVVLLFSLTQAQAASSSRLRSFAIEDLVSSAEASVVGRRIAAHDGERHRSGKGVSRRPASGDHRGSAPRSAVPFRAQASPASVVPAGDEVEAEQPESSISRVVGDWFPQAFPFFAAPPVGLPFAGILPLEARLNPSPEDGSRVGAPSSPGDPVDKAAEDTAVPQGGFRHLEIFVSHSSHVFQLQGISSLGAKQVLYTCRIGLGARDFPTPTGVYYVTHIYDDKPLWIPPPDRPWAFGQRASRDVYGGTMAPLLKKRFVRSRKQGYVFSEDCVAGKVRLEDYGYRFHGTNAPRSIGRNQSHGCVRMLSADASKVAGIIKHFVGVAQRSQSENGAYVVLRAPVRLNLVK